MRSGVRSPSALHFLNMKPLDGNLFDQVPTTMGFILPRAREVCKKDLLQEGLVI